MLPCIVRGSAYRIVSVHVNTHVEIVVCLSSSCTSRKVSNLVEKYKFGENKHNRKRSRVFMHTKTPSVTIQGNITAMRYRNEVIRSVLFLHIRANLDMMLARDYALCYADRSTLVMVVEKTCTISDGLQSVWI